MVRVERDYPVQVKYTCGNMTFEIRHTDRYIQIYMAAAICTECGNLKEIRAYGVDPPYIQIW